MEVYFKTNKSIIKMKERIDLEGEYLTTSSIDQKEKAILKKYENEEISKESFRRLISIIDSEIRKDAKNLFIEI